MPFEEGQLVEVIVRLRVPGPVTERQVRRYVTNALDGEHMGYGEDNPFYGFDGDKIEVAEVKLVE